MVLKKLISKKCNGLFVSGGNEYNYEVYKVLSDCFNVELNDLALKSNNESSIKYFFKSKNNRSQFFDFIISDAYSFALNLFPLYDKQIVILHHIDYKMMSKSLKHFVFYNYLLKKIRKVKKIIVVSRFWKQYLINNGVSADRIYVIYNSYNLSDYVLNQMDVEKFKSKYKLNFNKPLIYIGPASKVKGTKDVYDKLINKGYNLIMTGSENQLKELDAIYFNLPKDEFKFLLYICDVAIIMSKLPEGWNRLAHEAILLGVPVIGSGICGMNELLTKSNQIVCNDISKLNTYVDIALKKNNSKKFTNMINPIMKSKLINLAEYNLSLPRLSILSKIDSICQ